MPNVAALFVDARGIYPELLGRNQCWAKRDLADDARNYRGRDPVVAHPPCNLWVNMAAVNYARAIAPCPSCDGTATDFCYGGPFECGVCAGKGRQEPNRTPVIPAWYPGGDDDGCFASALASVRRCGGVLEHPAGSHAWEAHGILAPTKVPGWAQNGGGAILQYVCEVWQSAYGHGARKRTWLLYCGKRPPFELNWSREPGTHQCGWFDRAKPTLGKRAASATPRAFAEELIRLAVWSQG